MLSQGIVSGGSPSLVSSPADPALSASPATSGPYSSAPAAPGAVRHEMDRTQHNIDSQALEIAWEGEAGSKGAGLPAAAVATFISPDVSQAYTTCSASSSPL